MAASKRGSLLSTCVPSGGLSRFTSFFVPLVFSDDNIYTTSEERITLTRKTCFPASRYEIHLYEISLPSS